MDVSKTRRGYDARVWHIDEQSFTQATGRDRPYRQMTMGGVSYYAFCPACDNPIQMIGLFRPQEESKGRRPYARHTGTPVEGLGGFDEDAYVGCPYANPRHRRTRGRRCEHSRLGSELIRMMASGFDLVVAAWERSTGIHLSERSAEHALTRWRNDEAWRDYGSSYLNLPQMLLYSAPAQNLVKHYIVKGSELCERLAALDRIRLEPTRSDRYVQVMPVGGYVRLSYVLTAHTYEQEGDTVGEHYRLRVALDQKPAFEPLRVDVDPFWHDRPARRDDRLLDLASRILLPVMEDNGKQDR